MIKTIRIDTVEGLLPLLSEQDWREDLHRNRSSYVYRGMPNINYKMVTSLRRCCKDLQKSLEPAILNNFAKYAVIEDPTIAHSIWRQMILDPLRPGGPALRHLRREPGADGGS